jgi:hypothetical protein
VVSITPRPRFTPEKGPLVPIVQEAGWAPEPVWTQARGNILSPLPVVEPRSSGHPARSQTLYWLSYPAHYYLHQRRPNYVPWAISGPPRCFMWSALLFIKNKKKNNKRGSKCRSPSR